MERYVIVCLVKAEPLEFHEKIVGKICEKFDVKRQKLPGHITIKAPFETDDISEIEKLTENFCKVHKKNKMTLENYGHFRDSVIFMSAKLSKEAIKLYDSYINLLKEVKGLDWKINEGWERIFHCTVVSKLPKEKFNGIWSYVQEHPFVFHTYFDNITIMKWEHYKWNIYKKYNLN